MAEEKRHSKGLAVVTGASSGIGLCFALELARRGYDIMPVSNQNEELQEAARRIEESGVGAYPFFCDLTDPLAHEIILEYLDSKGMEADILVNNAGIFSFNTVGETSEGKLDCFIDLHCRAVTKLSRAFGLRMSARGKGRILNMSSMSCWTPMPGIAMYAATKAYIRVFTRALHYELRDSGVSVTAACPGGIATSLFGLPDNLMRLAIRLHAVQTPEKFVRKAVDKMLKGKKQYINGPINRLAIFAVGITPTPVRMLVKRKMLDRGIKR